MRTIPGRILTVLAAAALVVTLAPPGPAAAQPAEPEPAPVRVIVELAAPPALASAGPDTVVAAARAAHLARQQDALLARAERAGVDADVEQRFTAAYHGVAVTVPGGDVAALGALPGVTAVHPDPQVRTAAGMPVAGTPAAAAAPDTDGSAAASGEGMTIAIVDTGVDYTHPDLGGGFGPEHKVVAGHDFVNDDPDPMDDNGHGTHVAGIAAADGELTGAAPDARLTAYKVLGRGGSGQTSDMIAGLDAAVHPDNPFRADVVNLSLSGPGDGTDPMSVAATNAVDAGVVVVAAAGNTGPFRGGVRAPAAADTVLAVGATTRGTWLPRVGLVEPIPQTLRSGRFPFSGDAPEQPLRAEVIDVGDGAPGSYDDLDVTGTALLMELVTRVDPFIRARHAQDRGAAAVLFYIPDFWGFFPGGGGPGFPGPSSIAGSAAARDGAGEPVVDAFHTGFPPGAVTDGVFTATHDNRLDLVALQVSGAGADRVQGYLGDGPVVAEITGDPSEQVAGFSSRGPTGRFTPKPDLVAPGVDINSTVPGGAYTRASGTSMATPYVAGLAAQVRQQHPDWSAHDVAAALTGSAGRLTGAGPLDQGAGTVSGSAPPGVAARPPGVAVLGLADLAADPVTGTAEVTLVNQGGAPAELSLSALPAESPVGFPSDPPGLPEAAVAVTPPAVTLAPGDSLAVTVTATLPRPAGEGDVSGWLAVDTGDGTGLSVPYLLSVRRLRVHVSPDPAPAGTATSVYVRSPADLAGPPEVTVRCDDGTTHARVAAEVADRLWRASAPAGDLAGCRVAASGTAGALAGAPTVSGAGGYQVAADPDRNRGQAFWQSVGPNAAAGHLTFGHQMSRAGVMARLWPRLFLTRDGMQTWQEVATMPVAGGNPIAVAVHPRRPEIMYVAVNGGLDGSYRGKVLLTTDTGETWRELPVPDVSVGDLALSGDGTALAVLAGGALRVTGDDGATWTEMTVPGANPDLHWIGADLYVATLAGLFVIRDAAGPQPAEPELLIRPGVLGFAGQVAGDEDLLLVTDGLSSQLFGSRDGGETFDLMLRSPGISFQELELVGDEIYALQGNQLQVSRDRGESWESWGTPSPAAINADIGTWPRPHPSHAGRVYVSANGAGIYQADEPGGWQRTGIPAADVFSLAVASGDEGDVLIAGTARDTFRTGLPRRAAILPEDLEWTSSGGEGFTGVAVQFLEVSPDDPAVLYKTYPASFSLFTILRSTDAGESWETLATPGEAPTALMIHPADPDRIYAGYWSLTGEGLVISEDEGESWFKVDHGRSFLSLAGDPDDPDRIWAGALDGLYLSEDGGLSFTRISDHGPVFSIEVGPDDPRQAGERRLVLGGRGLYLSTDGGHTVQPAAHPDLDMLAGDLITHPDGRMFAATEPFVDELGVLKGGRGVLVSYDGGASWEPLIPGLSNLNVTSLAVSPDGRYLYAGTFGGSVHRIRL